MKSVLFVTRASVAVLGLGLVSCNELRTTLQKRDENQAKMDALVAESRGLEESLTTLKRNLPAEVQNGTTASLRAEQLQRELESFDQQLAAERQKVQHTEVQVAATQKELDGLRQKP